MVFAIFEVKIMMLQVRNFSFLLASFDFAFHHLMGGRFAMRYAFGMVRPQMRMVRPQMRQSFTKRGGTISKRVTIAGLPPLRPPHLERPIMTNFKHTFVALIASSTLFLLLPTGTIAAESQTGSQAKEDWCGPCKMVNKGDGVSQTGDKVIPKNTSNKRIIPTEDKKKTRNGRAQNRRVEINLKK